MPLMSQFLLALRNLTHRPLRFGVYLAGIGFAVLLMFVELGFWGSLLDSVVQLIDCMDADLIMVNVAKRSLSINEPFPLERLTQAGGVAGVQATFPLYVRVAEWHILREGNGDIDTNGNGTDGPHSRRRLIRVIAYDPSPTQARPPIRLEGVTKRARELHYPGVALFDTRSKNYFGMYEGLTTDLMGRQVHLIGTFTLGTDFACDGNLIMTPENYAYYFQGHTASFSPTNDVEVGLIRLEPGADAQAVKAELRARLPSDVVVVTRAEFKCMEQHFWQESTPVGFIFLLGLIVGFVVGVIICSQILSTDISDHLAEYATLKAIGFTNRYLTEVVLMEALLLSVLGYLPGAGLSQLSYMFLSDLTGLPMDFTPFRGLLILGFTVSMCVLSALISVGKVWVVDPAEVFA